MASNSIKIERVATASKGHFDVRIRQGRKTLRPRDIGRPEYEVYFGQDGWAKSLAVELAVELAGGR